MTGSEIGNTNFNFIPKLITFNTDISEKRSWLSLKTWQFHYTERIISVISISKYLFHELVFRIGRSAYTLCLARSTKSAFKAPSVV